MRSGDTGTAVTRSHVEQWRSVNDVLTYHEYLRFLDMLNEPAKVIPSLAAMLRERGAK